MTKRRLDDSGFANVLRQKHKEDPVLQQQAAQNTFAMLMKAQQRIQKPAITPNEASYQYFNNNGNHHLLQQPISACYKCKNTKLYDKCAFCENVLCQNCIQQCNLCHHLYCSTCSILDYSQSSDQVFCLSCKHT